jgi:hypothetical protein
VDGLLARGELPGGHGGGHAEDGGASVY